MNNINNSNRCYLVWWHEQRFYFRRSCTRNTISRTCGRPADHPARTALHAGTSTAVRSSKTRRARCTGGRRRLRAHTFESRNSRCDDRQAARVVFSAVVNGWTTGRPGCGGNAGWQKRCMVHRTVYPTRAAAGRNHGCQLGGGLRMTIVYLYFCTF